MSVRRHEAQSPTPAKGRARLQEVLDIGEQLRLAKLVDLGDDTGPKMGKEKAAKDTPYTKKEPDPTPTDLKKVPQDDLPKPTHAGLVVQTVKNQIQKSTEKECPVPSMISGATYLISAAHDGTSQQRV